MGASVSEATPASEALPVDSASVEPVYSWEYPLSGDVADTVSGVRQMPAMNAADKSTDRMRFFI